MNKWMLISTYNIKSAITILRNNHIWYNLIIMQNKPRGKMRFTEKAKQIRIWI